MIQSFLWSWQCVTQYMSMFKLIPILYEQWVWSCLCFLCIKNLIGCVYWFYFQISWAFQIKWRCRGGLGTWSNETLDRGINPKWKLRCPKRRGGSLMVKWVGFHILYLSVVMIKQNKQNNLEKRELTWAYGSRGLSPWRQGSTVASGMHGGRSKRLWVLISTMSMKWREQARMSWQKICKGGTSD